MKQIIAINQEMDHVFRMTDLIAIV
jgi:hypothetical protein